MNITLTPTVQGSMCGGGPDKMVTGNRKWIYLSIRASMRAHIESNTYTDAAGSLERRRQCWRVNVNLSGNERRERIKWYLHSKMFVEEVNGRQHLWVGPGRGDFWHLCGTMGASKQMCTFQRTFCRVVTYLPCCHVAWRPRYSVVRTLKWRFVKKLWLLFKVVATLFAAWSFLSSQKSLKNKNNNKQTKRWYGTVLN